MSWSWARAVALCLLASCKRNAPPAPVGQDAERACASACAALVSETCPADEPTKVRHRACRTSCVAAGVAAARAGCTKLHGEYLACVSALSAACAPAGVAAGTALENGAGMPACAEEHARYFACTRVCRDRGVVWTRSARLSHAGRQRDVQAELVSAGCSDPPDQSAKGGPGAPCTHYSVCSAIRCDCAHKRVSFLTRACVDGRCAEKGLACSLTPDAVAHDPCRP